MDFIYLFWCGNFRFLKVDSLFKKKIGVPLWCSGAAACIAAVAQVRSLAWELLHAADAAKNNNNSNNKNSKHANIPIEVI